MKINDIIIGNKIFYDKMLQWSITDAECNAEITNFVIFYSLRDYLFCFIQIIFIYFIILEIRFYFNKFQSEIQIVTHKQLIMNLTKYF